MDKTNKFAPEARERAVRIAQEHCGEYPSPWAAVELEREVKELWRATEILKLASAFFAPPELDRRLKS